MKLALFLLFAVGYTFFYILPNFRPLFPPALLPKLPIDLVVPLIPSTFLIYISDYLFIFFTICLIHDEEFFSFSRTMFAALAICGAFFLFFPTTYPRPEYPTVANPLIALAMNIVREGDMPTNCFPSMHVAMTGLSCWSLRNKSRGLYFAFILWTLLIFASTLTTKQHYFVDIVGGVAVIMTSAWLERVYLAERGRVKAWFSRETT